MSRRLLRGCVILAIVAAAASSRAEQPGPADPGYGVQFNQDLLERIKNAPEVDVEDLMAIFRHVFAALPEETRVYPTENYYYFTFFTGGIEYAGNLRFDVADRDDGVVHFAYYANNTPWSGEAPAYYRALTRADGVDVTREDPLGYRVGFEGKSVLFRLNDLDGVEPPEGAVREDERYLGPVFDESGIGFFLLFNETRKDFLFVLDERETVNDSFERVHPDHPALSIGRRTGFAVYSDRFADRRILVGVHAQDVEMNTYRDGPFDQLPDNFIAGEELRAAIVAKHPELDGEIDRFGGFRSQQGRFLVNPYRNYRHVAEVEGLLRCGDAALDEVRFYNCIFPPERQ